MIKTHWLLTTALYIAIFASDSHDNRIDKVLDSGDRGIDYLETALTTIFQR